MNATPAPAARPSTFTITTGLDLLADWTAAATQADRNTIYAILFSVADHSVFTTRTVIDDTENHMEFFVLARNDLTVKIRIDDFDSFAILYIGPASTAPGLTPASPAALTLSADPH
jgi:hypothetical protein